MNADEFAVVNVVDGNLYAVYDDETEALIDPWKIREAGWKPEDENDPCEQDHCDDDTCSCPAMTPEARAILRQWHDDNHDGAHRFCGESPCRELREVG